MNHFLSKSKFLLFAIAVLSFTQWWQAQLSCVHNASDVTLFILIVPVYCHCTQSYYFHVVFSDLLLKSVAIYCIALVLFGCFMYIYIIQTEVYIVNFCLVNKAIMFYSLSFLHLNRRYLSFLAVHRLPIYIFNVNIAKIHETLWMLKTCWYWKQFVKLFLLPAFWTWLKILIFINHVLKSPAQQVGSITSPYFTSVLDRWGSIANKVSYQLFFVTICCL